MMRRNDAGEGELNCKCLICKRLYERREGIAPGQISHGICGDPKCKEEYMRLYGPDRGETATKNPHYSTEDYEFAREIIDSEMGSFQTDPRGYVRSAGWDPSKIPGLMTMDIDFNDWDVKLLAGTIAELRASGMGDGEIMESSEVNDYLSNLVFGKIGTLMRVASRKEWMRNKRRALAARANPGRKSFDEATALLGYAIADRLFSEKDPRGTVSESDREWFGDWAHGRLAEMFNRDPKWNRRLRGPRGRDHAYMFVGHWMDSFMKSPKAFKDREHDRRRRFEMRGLTMSAGRSKTIRRNPGFKRRSVLKNMLFSEVPVDNWFRTADGTEYVKVSESEAMTLINNMMVVFDRNETVVCWVAY